MDADFAIVSNSNSDRTSAKSRNRILDQSDRVPLLPEKPATIDTLTVLQTPNESYRRFRRVEILSCRDTVVCQRALGHRKVSAWRNRSSHCLRGKERHASTISDFVLSIKARTSFVSVAGRSKCFSVSVRWPMKRVQSDSEICIPR